MIQEFSMVRFISLNSSNPDSVSDVSQHIDFVTQYGEDLEPKEDKEAEEMGEDDADAKENDNAKV